MLVGRMLLGRPLPSSAAAHERLSRPAAIGAFGLDALSSVAYGPDEILYVLLLAGSAGLALDIPIAVAIAALLAIVAFSYRQTIYAYPHGGGSFTVASENLGVSAGLIAAAALMVDYLTTVAVSVTAGVAAIVAFAPRLDQHRVLIDIIAIVLLMFINLRGVREAGTAFIVPTYIFVGSIALLLLVGGVRILTGHAPGELHPTPAATEGLSVFIVLRAFAGGCTAMTGVEAIANGVPAFKPPESKNAASTLTVLALTLGALFLGVAIVGRYIGAIPSDQTNVLAQIGQAMAPDSPLYYLVQISAAVILLLAANTSFNGFPRLAAVMAREDYFPHQFSHRGLRLAYSNGILSIGIAAIILVVVFNGSTHALIPLFAVGVFLCFTLSQAGMVVHWLRAKGPGWRAKLVINGLGAVTTGLVTLIVAGTKFIDGAWVVLVLIPFLVANFWGIHRHYATARAELASPPPPEPHDKPLRCEPSPYREVIGPLLQLITRSQKEAGGSVTVMLPEVVPHAWYEEPLHNQLSLAIKLALLYHPGIVVTSVPVRLSH